MPPLEHNSVQVEVRGRRPDPLRGLRHHSRRHLPRPGKDRSHQKVPRAQEYHRPEIVSRPVATTRALPPRPRAHAGPAAGAAQGRRSLAVAPTARRGHGEGQEGAGQLDRPKALRRRPGHHTANGRESAERHRLGPDANPAGEPQAHTLRLQGPNRHAEAVLHDLTRGHGHIRRDQEVRLLP